MEIQFISVDRTNYLECIALSIDETQKDYVALNVFSLAQAAYEPEMYPLAIYHDGKMVGFILYDFDEELAGWSMSRFMIDKKYQRQGLGKEALSDFIRYFFQLYDASELYTSVEVDNSTAITLYEKTGFIRQDVFEYDAGGKHYKEIRMLLKKESMIKEL